MAETNLSGEWMSTYHYHDGNDSSRHVLDVIHTDDAVRAQSRPQPDGSVVSLELTYAAAHRTLRGSWHESTSPDGAYRGIEFDGLVQLLLERDLRRAEGIWVGNNTSKTSVNHGVWILERVSASPNGHQ